MSAIASITLWEPAEPVPIPANADSASTLLAFSKQLGERDTRAIARAFQDEDYEMMSTYVWSKASASLKLQIASLGMDFVGELLSRPDLEDDSDPVTSIRDHEAVRLAEQLGMVDPTEAMRLRHAMQLVNHFSAPAKAQDEGNEPRMLRVEAVAVLHACIKSVLGLPRAEVAYQFKTFRESLETRPLSSTDDSVASYAQSPYFFRRTIISVLLSRLRSAVGAQLEHVIGNVNVLIPLFWSNLKQPERWNVGNAYAELFANGQQAAAAGLRRALQGVRGFDYVPETLRSQTFIAAAQKVVDAHFALNNFYNEPEPMRILSQLGSTIPKPAFPICMTATLCVRLGNSWGDSWSAQAYAKSILAGLRREQWDYYLSHCMGTDTIILSKLASGDRQLDAWRQVVRDYSLGQSNPSDRDVAKLITDTISADEQARAATRIIGKANTR